MATRSIVPKADGEGAIGTNLKKWGSVNTNVLASASHNLKLNSTTTVPSNDSTFIADPIYEEVRTFIQEDPLSSSLFNLVVQQIVNQIAYTKREVETQKDYIDEQLDVANERIADLREELTYGVIKYDITIPVAAWFLNSDDPSIGDTGRYQYHADVIIHRVTENMIPSFIVDPSFIDIASSVGLCGACQTLDRTFRVFSINKPSVDICGTLTLLNVKVINNEEAIMNKSIATPDEIGLVKPGTGLTIDLDGTLSINPEIVLTDEDMADEEEAHTTLTTTLNDPNP